MGSAEEQIAMVDSLPHKCYVALGERRPIACEPFTGAEYGSAVSD